MKSIKIDIAKLPAHYWETLLKWSSQFENVAIFEPQQAEQYPFGGFNKCIAVGHKKLQLKTPYFQSLKYFIDKNPTKKLFGYLSYDLKNELEKLESKNHSSINWELLSFFVPSCNISFNSKYLTIESEEPDYYLEEIQKAFKAYKKGSVSNTRISDLKVWTSKDEYLEIVKKLKKHIEEGDIYEINFCINFSAYTENLHPIAVFKELCRNSPAPFASYLKIDKKHIISASPERFIKLEDKKIISQPIKGTAKRGQNASEDLANKKRLAASDKERAENMMIVDLVRNDLAKSAKAGSIKVEEIFGIYSFQQVHQMISTISASKKEDTHPVDIIKNAFPMGSMTGAPKIRAMELIEKYENSKRNAFSGSIGYFHGNMQFDFNVLIRSIFYDEETKVLNYQVGSAITYDSDAEAEYAECLLKAAAIKKTLGII